MVTALSTTIPGGGGIKSLQQTVQSLGATAVTDVTIAAVDVSKTEIEVCGWAGAPGWMVQLLNSTTLRFTGYTGAGYSQLSVQVRELASNVKSIQRGVVSPQAANTGNITIAGIDLAKGKWALRLCGCYANSGQGQGAAIWVANATTLSWSTSGLQYIGFSWELTEYIQ